MEGIIGVQITTPQCSEIDVTHNTITNLMFGIIFTGANAYYGFIPATQNIHGTFEISNNRIQADLGGQYSFVQGENVSVGIIVNNDPSTSVTDNENDCNLLNVNNNSIYNVRNGILMENWQYFYQQYNPNNFYCIGNRPVIMGNYISLVDPENPNYNSQFGIYTALNRNGVILDNYVQGFDNSVLGYYGIICANNESLFAGPQGNGIGYGQVVECNYVINNGIGIEFDGDQQETKFLNNVMNASQMGLVLNAARLGIQGALPDFASNNEWPVSSYSTGQFKTYTVQGSDPNNSEMIVDAFLLSGDQDPEAPQGQPSLNGNDVNANNLIYSFGIGLDHITTTDASPIVCVIPSSKSGNTGITPIAILQGTQNNQIKWLERLVKDSANYTVFAEEQHINDLFRVYRMIEVIPMLKDSSLTLRDFYNIAKHLNIGSLLKAENELASGQLIQTSSTLSSVLPQNNIESNYIDFYNVFIHYKNNSFTVADSAVLKKLVDGCPLKDGMAVRKARLLYSMIYKDYTLYPDNCKDNNPKKDVTDVNNITASPANLSMEVYPNPNNGTFTISLNGNNSISESAEVGVFDILGNQISMVNLYLKKNIAIFDTELSNGIYFISVKDSKGNVYNPRKIIVIK